MRGHWFIACIVLVASLLARERFIRPAVAQSASPSRPPTSEQGAKLAERDRLVAQAVSLQSAGKYSEALALGLRKLEIEREVLGKLHDDVVATLRRLAELHALQDDFTNARKKAREAFDIQSKLLKAKPWQVAEARRTLNWVDELASMDGSRRRQIAEANRLEGQVLDFYLKGKIREDIKLALRIEEAYRQALTAGHPDHATSLNNLGVLYHSMGNYDRAESLYRKALDIFKPTLGEDHPDYVTTLNNLAVLYGLKGDYAGALPLYRRALELRGRVVAESHPDYVRSVNNLAWLYKAMGEYAQAEPLYLKALTLQQQGIGYGWPNARILEIFRRVDLRLPPVGAKLETDRALIMGNLAVLYHETGDYARAEPLYRQTLDITKRAVGERHADYARHLNNLAGLYQLMGDHARAETLYQRAVALRKQALGEKHPDYAAGLHNLARFYHLIDDYDRAEPLYLQALAIRKQTLGEKHPYYAQTLDKLAWLYHAKEDYARAEPLYARALEIRGLSLKDKHRYDATIVTNQAMLYQALGDHDRAEFLFHKSLAWTKKEVGDENPEYARTLHYLAMLQFARKKYADGERLARLSVDISRRLLEHCAAIQSQRQQLAMIETSRFYLDGYLSLAAEAKVPAERVYAQVLAWKGAVTLRQQTMRRLRRTLEKEGQPEALKLYRELEQATRKLAALSQSIAQQRQPENSREELDRLSAAIERLEQALAGVSAEFRKGREQQRRTPADIARALPADAVLIDLLEYDHSTPPKLGKGEFRSERRLAAFVIHRNSPIERIDLGPAAPISEAVDSWRRGLLRKSVKPDQGRPLYRLLCGPLARQVRGASLVLVSPDGAVARVPWAVLPGSKPGSYLIEERALAVVPVPAQLPEMMARSREIAASPSILLVGDVNFDALPGAARQLASAHSAPHATRTGTALHWGHLPGTRTEIAAIKETFQKRFSKSLMTDLRQDGATEEMVRVQAPRHRYLHFATHGFFAANGGDPDKAPARQKKSTRSPRIATDLAGFHPGLLSGLVLAGANQSVQAERDDGILTALEVAELDLAEVELAVLSACETGLGKSTGGEGLLGLQRAFQMAGARSVVAGLWKVPDRGTQVLMQRYYDNLWRKNMGKLEALRQAQLWMLREGEQLAGLVRGLDVDTPLPVRDGRLSPFYWGAFVLSGDWR